MSRLLDLYSPTQARDYHGRWTDGDSHLFDSAELLKSGFPKRLVQDYEKIKHVDSTKPKTWPKQKAQDYKSHTKLSRQAARRGEDEKSEHHALEAHGIRLEMHAIETRANAMAEYFHRRLQVLGKETDLSSGQPENLLPLASDFLFGPTPHEEAIAFLNDKAPVSRQVFDQLLPELKARAFTVTGVEGLNILQDLRDSIAELPAGANWDDVKKDLVNQLSPWLVDPNADPETRDAQLVGANRRAELLLRTHGFQAYQAAAYQVHERQKDVFPYAKYLTQEDGKVRPSHAVLDGLILPVDDPFWQDHTGPWDWGCRCMRIPISRSDYEDAQAADKKLPLEERSILNDAQLDLLKTQGLVARRPAAFAKSLPVTGPISVVSPSAQGKPGAFRFRPGELGMDVNALRARYTASEWAQFQGWAQKQEVSPNFTVWAWLNKEKPTPQTSQPKVTGAPAGVPNDLAERIRARMDASAVALGLPPLSELDDILQAEILAYEQTIVGLSPEHGTLYSSEGKVVWKGKGQVTNGQESITPQGSLLDNIFTHNHPNNLPHSLQDLQRFMRENMKEVRVVTDAGVYSVTRGSFPQNAQTRQKMSQFIRQVEPQINAAVVSLKKELNLTDAQAFTLHLRSLWEELAAQGFIGYHYQPWTL